MADSSRRQRLYLELNKAVSTGDLTKYQMAQFRLKTLGMPRFKAHRFLSEQLAAAAESENEPLYNALRNELSKIRQSRSYRSSTLGKKFRGIGSPEISKFTDTVRLEAISPGLDMKPPQPDQPFGFIDNLTVAPATEMLYHQIGTKRLPSFGDKYTKHTRLPILKPILRANRNVISGSNLIFKGFYLTDIDGELKDLPALQSLFKSEVFTRASDIEKLQMLSERYREIKEQTDTIHATYRWLETVRRDPLSSTANFPRRKEEIEELLLALRKTDPMMPTMIPGHVLEDPEKRFGYWLRTVESGLYKHKATKEILDTHKVMRDIQRRNSEILMNTLQEDFGWQYLTPEQRQQALMMVGEEDRSFLAELFQREFHMAMANEMQERAFDEVAELAQQTKSHGLNLTRLARGYGDWLMRSPTEEEVARMTNAVDRFKQAAALGRYTRLSGDRVPYKVLDASLEPNKGWTATVKPLALDPRDVRFSIDISKIGLQGLADFDPSQINDIRAQELLEVVDSEARRAAVEILSNSALGKHLLASQGVTQGTLVFSRSEFDRWFERLSQELGTYEGRTYGQIGSGGKRIPIPQSVIDVIRSEAPWVFADDSREIDEVISSMYLAMRETIPENRSVDFTHIDDNIGRRLIGNFLNFYLPEQGGLDRLTAQRARYLHDLVKQTGVTDPDDALLLALVNQLRKGMPENRWETTFQGRWLRTATDREILDYYNYLKLAPENTVSLQGRALTQAARDLQARLQDMPLQEALHFADDHGLNMDVVTRVIEGDIDVASQRAIDNYFREAISSESGLTILESNKRRIKRSLTVEEIMEVLDMNPELRAQIYRDRTKFNVRGVEPKGIWDLLEMQQKLPALEITARAKIDGKWQTVIPQMAGRRVILTSKSTATSYYLDSHPQITTIPITPERPTFSLGGSEDLLDLPRAGRRRIPVYQSVPFNIDRTGRMRFREYQLSPTEVLRTIRDDVLPGKPILTLDIETTGFSDQMMDLAKRLYPDASPEELTELARNLFYPTEFAFQVVRYRDGIMEAIDDANRQAVRILVEPTNQIRLAVAQMTSNQWTLGQTWQDIDVGYLRNVAKYAPEVDLKYLLTEVEGDLPSEYLDYLRKHAPGGIEALIKQGKELGVPIEQYRGFIHGGISTVQGHNVAGFDLPAMYEFQRRVDGDIVKPSGVVDTLMLSRGYYDLERDRLEDIVRYTLGDDAHAEFLRLAHLAGNDVRYTNLVAGAAIKRAAERGFDGLEYLGRDATLLRISSATEPNATRGIYRIKRFLYPGDALDGDPNTLENTYRLIIENTRTGAVDEVSALTRYDLERKIQNNFLVSNSPSDLENYDRMLALDDTQRLATKARTSAISMNYRMAFNEANMADAFLRSEKTLEDAIQHYNLGIDTALEGWQREVRMQIFPHTTYGRMFNEFQEYLNTYEGQINALRMGGMSEEAAKRRAYSILTDRQRVFLQNRQMFTEDARVAFINQGYMSPRTLQTYDEASEWLHSEFVNFDRRFLNQLEDLRRTGIVGYDLRSNLIGEYIQKTGEIFPVPMTRAINSVRVGRITHGTNLATDINIAYWNENQAYRSFYNVIEDIADKTGVDQTLPKWQQGVIDDVLLPALREQGLIGEEIKRLDSAVDIVYNTILDNPARFPAAEVQDYNRMVREFITAP
jgi:hypothetical protein